MILTPVALEAVPPRLDAVRVRLPAGGIARRVLDRIAATAALVPDGVDTPAQRAAAVELARRFGIPTLAEPPQRAFSWDGRVLRTESEAYVLLHEVAHWQLCPPERRPLLDFGLGAGPESGFPDRADAQRAADEATRQLEECLSSLLGILWEEALRQPALLAFLEQNWLEGWDRPACAENLAFHVGELHRRGLIDDAGRPVGPDIADLVTGPGHPQMQGTGVALPDAPLP